MTTLTQQCKYTRLSSNSRLCFFNHQVYLLSLFLFHKILYLLEAALFSLNIIGELGVGEKKGDL